MAEPVVDRFESVKIDEKHPKGQVLFGALRA
jgi:hypothetical protein